MVLSKSVGDVFNFSKMELTIDQSVTITRSFYPPLSVTKLFADLGGAMGLWLGVGIIQMFGYGLNAAMFAKYLRRKMTKNKECE